MTVVLIILLILCFLGAADNLIHHELQAKLPTRLSARREIALHAAREAIYGLVFITLAWFEPTGAWAWVLACLLLGEIGITAADFLEEDRTRTLPPAERVLHLALAVGYGVFLAAFGPILIDWMARPTGLALTGYGWLSVLMTMASAGVLAWSVRNWIAFVRSKSAQTIPGDPMPDPAGGARTILVAGGTGFIGAALVRTLLVDNARVIILTRDRRQARAQFGDAAMVIDRLDDLPDEMRIDAIVNMVGAPVIGLRWTRKRKQILISSRVDTSDALIALVNRLNHKPEVMISASAVGFYGTGDDGPVDERASGQSDFGSELCQLREAAAGQVEGLGVRNVCLRFGMVLGRSGGILPPMAFASRLGLGALIGDGQQPFPWIHLHDAVGLVRFAIITPTLTGAVNATAPTTPRQCELAHGLAKLFGRRCRLTMPGALLRCMLGEQSSLLLHGRVVVPAQAIKAGYQFRHSQFESALSAEFPPPSADHTSRTAHYHVN